MGGVVSGGCVTGGSVAGGSVTGGSVTGAAVSETGAAVAAGSVVSSGEHKNLPICAPYGVLSIPPARERAVVLPLDDGEVSIGVLAAAENLSEGEVMLRSSGGASIVLKNDGTVLINGRVIE